jgi:hypothetical protein
MIEFKEGSSGVADFKDDTAEIGIKFKVICKNKLSGEKSFRFGEFETIETSASTINKSTADYSFKCQCGQVFSNKTAMSIDKLVTHIRSIKKNVSSFHQPKMQTLSQTWALLSAKGPNDAAAANLEADAAKKQEAEDIAEAVELSELSKQEEEEARKNEFCDDEGDNFDSDDGGGDWEDMDEEDVEDASVTSCTNKAASADSNFSLASTSSSLFLYLFDMFKDSSLSRVHVSITKVCSAVSLITSFVFTLLF